MSGQPSDTLLTVLAGHARSRPSSVALYFPSRRFPSRHSPSRHSPSRLRSAGSRHDSGQPGLGKRAGYTAVRYADLARRTDALAAGFAAIGLSPGARAAMLVPPGEDFFAVAFGLLKAGAVPVLIDPGIGRRALRTCLGEAAPTAFVGVPRAHAARRALRWCPDVEHLVTVGRRIPGGGPTLRSLERYGAGRPYAPPPVDPDAVAAIAYTSGSTGVPKGVEYRHRNFLAQVSMIRELYDIAPGEVSVATFPPFALLGPLLGSTTVVPRMDPTRPARVNPERLAEAVRSFGATVLFGSPALLDTVSRWGEATGERLPTLRRVISAGAPVPAKVIRRTLAMLPPDAVVSTPYGATEALPVSSVDSAELLSLAEPGVCVGRLVPGVDAALIAITEQPLDTLAAAKPVAAGEVGEIVVRGPNVTAGYADRPAATAAAKLDWDGVVAHRMGDLGRFDDTGRLWYCGRLVHRVTGTDGMIPSSPAEEIVNTHPAVRRSALVGVGPAGAQRPVICVQLEPGTQPSAQLTAELQELAASSPATSAISTVLYRKDFPVDIRHNSKINRPQVAAWAARELAKGPA